MTLQDIRSNRPFFEGISDLEITESMKLDPAAVNEVALKVIHREWDSVMDLCSKETPGYRLLLAASLKDQITDPDAATGLLFLHIFYASGKTSKVSEYQSPETTIDYKMYQMKVPSSLELDIKRLPAVLEMKAWRDICSGHFQWTFIGGLSTRGNMIRRLLELQSDVAILLPNQSADIHGLNVSPVDVALHDLLHTHARNTFFNWIGEGSFKNLILIADMLEKILPTLPDFTQPLNMKGANPLLHKNSTFEDKVRYLIDMAAGMIVDSAPFLSSPYKIELDQSSMRLVLEDVVKHISSDFRPFKPKTEALIEDVLSGKFLTEEHIEKAMTIIERTNRLAP